MPPLPPDDTRTCNQEHFAETEEKKSRFLAFFMPYAALDVRLVELKHTYPKANHHVVAARWWADERVFTLAKDDGEPAGTSGMPMLKVLDGLKLIDVAVVCVRFFGGTKLGTGGLARAYSGAARSAIDQADREGGLVPWDIEQSLSLELDFSAASRLEEQVQKSAVRVVDRAYGTHGVTLTLSGPSRALEAFR